MDRLKRVFGPVSCFKVYRSNSNERGVSSFLTNGALVILIGLILLSTVVMDQKRVRTVVGLKRVEKIHQSIVSWQDQVMDQKGHGGVDGPPVPKGPQDLAKDYPEAAKWLKDGDGAYKYEFSGLRYDRGNVYPLVSAVARDPQRVIAEELISNPDGTAKVGRVSESGRKISLTVFPRENPVLAGAILLVAVLYAGMKFSRKRE
jgi:hypothetical protein